MSERVCWWSASLSPQKPEMKSDEMDACGSSSRTRLISCKYVSREWPRRMLSRTALEPDCAGMWSAAHALGSSPAGWEFGRTRRRGPGGARRGRSPITRSSASGKSFGCGEVKRKRTCGREREGFEGVGER